MSSEEASGQGLNMHSDNIVEIKNLEHSYGKNKVLHGLSFNVRKGSIFGLLGKNGAGKTTSINIMMGFLRPDSGSCLILGEEAHSLSSDAKRKIGLLHEGHLSYEFLSIAETEEFYEGFYPAWDSDVYNDMINKLKLKRTHKIKNMSCGQRSQVALAVLMAQGAEILILDDFSMGLDAGYRRLFLDMLTHYSKQLNKTVMITSHIVQDLERFVDDALIIEKGVVLKKAPIGELKQGLNKFFFCADSLLSNMDAMDFVHDYSVLNRGYEIVTGLDADKTAERLSCLTSGMTGFEQRELSLEDAFIALTGKY